MGKVVEASQPVDRQLGITNPTTPRIFFERRKNTRDVLRCQCRFKRQWARRRKGKLRWYEAYLARNKCSFRNLQENISVLCQDSPICWNILWWPESMDQYWLAPSSLSFGHGAIVDPEESFLQTQCTQAWRVFLQEDRHQHKRERVDCYQKKWHKRHWCEQTSP